MMSWNISIHMLHERGPQQALQLLRRDCSAPDGVGPRRVAGFPCGAPSDEPQADVSGFVQVFFQLAVQGLRIRNN
jgi:hypothetical protein